MKVLYYTHTYFLDCDLPLVEKLINKGLDVMLVVDLPYYQLKSTMVNISKQKTATRILKVEDYQELEFISHYIPKDKVFLLNRSSKVYSLGNLIMRYRFSKLINKFNPDIIHCTDFIDFSDFFFYKHRSKILQIVHDPFPHSGERTLKKRFLRFIEYKAVKNYVLLNSMQENEFVVKNKLGGARIYQASLGVYTCLKEFKNNQSLMEGEDYVLFFGRISPYKGVEYLIHAMSLIHKGFPNLKLVIAGGGNLYFREMLQDRPYIEVINKYLTMEELFSLIANCKFVVCPYIDATQSGVVMSSYALNKVVVGTDVGGLPQMLGMGEFGPIVPAKDSKCLAFEINRLLSNKEVLSEYESKIKEACSVGSFSWQTIATKYINIYKNIKDDTII